MTTKKVLILDDDRQMCELIASAVEGLGMKCISTSNADDFLKAVTPDINLIVLDLLMPEVDGIQVLRMLGEMRCRIGIVVMSGVGKRVLESAESLALNLGLSIVDNLVKPFSIAQLKEILTRSPTMQVVRNTKPTGNVINDVAALARAIDQDEFVLHYQPQIEIATGRCLGVEALVRWERPGHGLIAPDKFIEFAEIANLIDDLTWIIIKRGMSEMGNLKDRDGETLSIAFNISVSSLRHISFPDNFFAIASEYGVSPEKVILEVTESRVISAMSETLEVLTRLAMRKVRLSIDDFGTGYAMMQQLRLVPANELKIDRTMMENLHSESQQVLVQKMIELSGALDMVSVAEGVETREQLEFLRSKGCDIAQGYYFSKPLPKAEFLAWLETYQKGLRSLPSSRYV